MSTAMTMAPPPDAAGASEFGFEVVITVTSVPDLVAPGELHQVAVLMDLSLSRVCGFNFVMALALSLRINR